MKLFLLPILAFFPLLVFAHDIPLGIFNLTFEKDYIQLEIKLEIEDIEKAVSQIHQKEKEITANEESEPVSIQKKPIVEEKVITKAESNKKAKSAKSKTQIPKPVRFSFNMTKDLHRKFKIYCLEKDITMSDEILTMIQKVVSKSQR